MIVSWMGFNNQNQKRNMDQKNQLYLIMNSIPIMKRYTITELYLNNDLLVFA